MANSAPPVLSRWPPPAGLSTPLVSRQDTILPISASLRIHAPAHLVWAAVLDTSKYPEWNSFCPRVDIRSQPPSRSSKNNPATSAILHHGTHFTFQIRMNSSKPTSYTPTELRVTDYSTPAEPSAYIASSILASDPSYTADLGTVYRIAWTTEGGFVARGLRTERFHEIIVRGENECEVRTWECQGGILARTVKWLYGELLQRKFADWCEDLKGWCEGKAGDAGQGEGGRMPLSW